MNFQPHDFERGPDIWGSDIRDSGIRDSGVVFDSGQFGVATTGVPLRCHRPMLAATLTVPTALSVFGTMLMALLTLSRGALLVLPRGAMMVPALLRTRHHRRA